MPGRKRFLPRAALAAALGCGIALAIPINAPRVSSAAPSPRPINADSSPRRYQNKVCPQSFYGTMYNEAGVLMYCYHSLDSTNCTTHVNAADTVQHGLLPICCQNSPPGCYAIDSECFMPSYQEKTKQKKRPGPWVEAFVDDESLAFSGGVLNNANFTANQDPDKVLFYQSTPQHPGLQGQVQPLNQNVVLLYTVNGQPYYAKVFHISEPALQSPFLKDTYLGVSVKQPTSVNAVESDKHKNHQDDDEVEDRHHKVTYNHKEYHILIGN
jgi:hypothetical protein